MTTETTKPSTNKPEGQTNDPKASNRQRPREKGKSLFGLVPEEQLHKALKLGLGIGPGRLGEYNQKSRRIPAFFQSIRGVRDEVVALSVRIVQPGILELRKEGPPVYGFQFDVCQFNITGIVCPWFDDVSWYDDTAWGLSLQHEPIPDGLQTVCQIAYSDPVGRLAVLRNPIVADGNGSEFVVDGMLFTQFLSGSINRFPFGEQYDPADK